MKPHRDCVILDKLLNLSVYQLQMKKIIVTHRNMITAWFVSFFSPMTYVHLPIHVCTFKYSYNCRINDCFTKMQSQINVCIYTLISCILLSHSPLFFVNVPTYKCFALWTQSVCLLRCCRLSPSLLWVLYPCVSIALAIPVPPFPNSSLQRHWEGPCGWKDDAIRCTVRTPCRFFSEHSPSLNLFQLSVSQRVFLRVIIISYITRNEISYDT